MDKRYILVTGSSSGIGEHVATILSAQYNIVLCGRDKERLQRTKDKCASGNHLIWQFDLVNTSEIENSLSEFICQSGIEIQKFVHCAGVVRYVPAKTFSVESFGESFNTNVISAALIVKTLLSKKNNNKALDNVVFISSNISNFGAKAHAVYSASKSALDGLMRSLAVELAPKIRVNSVLPGGIRTPATEKLYQDDELICRMEASYPLGLGETDDIAKAVKFLLSDESRWITGQQLTVDGGRTINITG